MVHLEDILRRCWELCALVQVCALGSKSAAAAAVCESAKLCVSRG